jgi:predicted transposase/invertase (TIGR01784 family)
MANNNYIRFDWAIKRLLRNKADHLVLEGFLSVLLNDGIKVKNIKESASNKASANDKFNIVDILVENSRGELMIIEIQNTHQSDYYLRMLYGVSKAIAEHIVKGDKYHKVRKVYHISILYFKLGGDDYVYWGGNEFRGLHTGSPLVLTDKEKEYLTKRGWSEVQTPKDLYPEYCLLCADDFDKVAKNSLDEWMHYLKNTEIPDSFTAPGLPEARLQLRQDSLSEQEKIDYRYYLKRNRYENDTIESTLEDGIRIGRAEGEVIGLEKGEVIGLEKEKIATISRMSAKGKSIEDISDATDLPPHQIQEILHALKQ